MNYAKKIDANQNAIVAYLRARGASVCVLSAVGNGCPDLLIGWAGENYLCEVNVGKAKGQTAGTLTEDQVKWHAAWKGQVVVVRNNFDAEKLLRGESLTKGAE